MGLATPAPSPPGRHKEDKMLAWLQFDEGTGTTVADASGNNNSGAFVNSPAWVDGFKGKALEFNNTDKGGDRFFCGVECRHGVYDNGMGQFKDSIGSASTDDAGIFNTKNHDGDTVLLWWNADAQGGGNPSYSFNVGAAGTASNRVNDYKASGSLTSGRTSSAFSPVPPGNSMSMGRWKLLTKRVPPAPLPSTAKPSRLESGRLLGIST